MNIVKRIGLPGAIAIIVLVALLTGASIAFAQGAPPTTPDQPTGTAVFIGGVDLEWNEVPGAESYDVQLYRNGQWIDLPRDGIKIAFYGAGAIISGLNHEGSSYWFQVRANNAHGSSDWSPYSFMAPTSQFDSGKRARPSNVPASGAPVITGTAQVGETLTADTTGIADENGLARVEFRFQWVSNDGSADTDIGGAEDSTYTLTANDEGKTVEMRVSFTDRGGYAESLTSAGTEPVASSEQATPIPTQETTPEPSKNSPATGAPAITGTAQVGETLTADTAGIADADGLANVSYSYQWVANDGTKDTEIAGATDPTYILVATDEGKAIKVRVSFTDDARNDETLTSTATEAVAARPNSPATGAPTITGTAEVGETLTVDTSGISDSDGLSGTTFSYQWVSNDGTTDTDIAGATDSTYILAATDEGKTIKVRVSFTDDAGNDETLTSTATEVISFAVQQQIVNSPATGAPAITGAAQVGETLTADTAGISDADGLANVSYSYQWVSSDGTSDTDITGAKDSTYTLAADDEGMPIKVKVTFTDDAGYEETLTSAATAPVAGAPLSALSVSHGTLTPTFNSYTSSYTVPDVANADTRITITATPMAGFTVVFFETSGEGQSVFAAVVYSFGAHPAECGRSYSDGLNPLPELADADPNTPGFQVDLYDGKNYVHVRVYPTNSCNLGTGYGLAITRAEGSVSLVRPNKPATGIPYIGGMARDSVTGKSSPWVGSSLSADVSDIYDRDGWDVATFSYQWLADDAEIAGATGSSYTVAAADLGKALGVRVSFTDDRGNEESVSRSAREVVRLPNSKATGKPIVLGTAEVGQTLSADVSGISDANGLTNATFRYDWYGLGRVRYGEEYTPVAADEGRTIKVRVTYTDDDGHGEEVYSDATAAVAARSNNAATGAPSISGTAQVGETLTAYTSGIADADGLTNVSYSYQWIANDGTSDADITGATHSTYTLIAADEGKTIKVQVTFTDDAANEETLTSTATEEVSFAVQQQVANSAATGAPTITGTAQVGETLTVDTAGIADADGLDNATFSYQWVTNDGSADADISGATASIYALTADDEGQTIKVRVSFTDDATNEETLTSTATEEVSFAVQQQVANSAATGAPTITGTAQVGETLTVDTAGIADADGLDNATFSYQWVTNDESADADISGATASIYALTADEEGQTIKVRVSFTDDATNEESLTSDATAAVAAQAQADSEAVSYMTVVVTEDASDPNNVISNFTITWSDADNCSTNYNAYLNIKPAPETPGSQLHLGSAAFRSTQITKVITVVDGSDAGSDVELYCGTDGSGRLVSRVDIPSPDERPWPGTYSTEPPLTALSVSHGTLTPTFNKFASDYTVPDIANADTRITITATPKAGYTVVFFETSGEGQSVFAAVVYSFGAHPAECGRSYSDGLNPLPELADADPNTPGFQVDLYDQADLNDGVNDITAWVYPTDYCSPGTGYGLAITRAEGSVSLVRPNKPATGIPYIGGMARDSVTGKLSPWVGSSLSAVVSQIYDRDGLDKETFSYQWLADDAEIAGATGSSYTVAAADLGKALGVRVSFTDDRGNEESVSRSAREVVRLPNSKATGKPIVLGTAEVGQTLSADVSGISDANGLTNATFRYDWYGLGRVRYGEEYTPVAADEGRTIKVRVTYTDDDGHGEEVYSDATAAVAARSNNAATGAPAITGTAQVGETLTAYTSGIADADGLSNVSYSYQWVANDGTSDADITGATHSTYTLIAADEGKTIKVQVTFTDDAANEETLTSTATEEVSFAVQQQAANSAATGAPTITGTAQVGETLTADTSGIADADGLDNATFSYQWVANDGSAEADISGATASIYALTADDEGQTIRVRVSFTDGAGHGETLISAATVAVAAAEPQEPPEKPRNLEAEVNDDGTVTLTWDDPGDDSITGYQILRRNRDTSAIGVFEVHVEDTGSAATSYVDRDLTPETRYIYRVKARNESGLSLRSNFVKADTPPAQNNPATGRPAINGTAQVGETLTADTTGITDADGLNGTTFSYQWVSNDGTSDTDISGATAATYTLVSSDEGKTIKVRVSFTDNMGYGETLISAATAAVAAQNNPTIDGTARVGETLTADTSGIAEGLSGVTFSYQWVSNDGTTDTDIVGATGSTYTLTANDEGKTIKVRVTFTVTSAATEPAEEDGN